MPNGVQPPARRLLTPTAGEYWPMDLTLDEERARLRREYARYMDDPIHLRRLLRERHIDLDSLLGARDPAALESGPWLIEQLVDVICPREWLDRRLREEG